MLADSAVSFTDHCIKGIEPREDNIKAALERSLMLVTALAPKIGYDNAAKIAKKAHAEGTTLRQAAVALGLLTAEKFDAVKAQSLGLVHEAVKARDLDIEVERQARVLLSSSPAALAATKHQVLTGQPLRAFTYTHAEYQELFEAAGFTEVETHAAFPDYKLPELILPCAPAARPCLALLRGRHP